MPTIFDGLMGSKKYGQKQWGFFLDWIRPTHQSVGTLRPRKDPGGSVEPLKDGKLGIEEGNEGEL